MLGLEPEEIESEEQVNKVIREVSNKANLWISGLMKS